MERIKKTKWIYFFISISALFIFWEYSQNRKVELLIPSVDGKNVVLTLPWKDKKSLDFFFKTMLALDDGSYTLFGTKPMYMGNYIIPFSVTSLGIFLDSLSPKNLRVYWGWKTWQKYQDLLEESDFLLWAEENPFCLRWWPPPNPAVAILLIHKKRLEEMIVAHISDFQNVLGPDMLTCEQLLLETKTKPLLKEILKDHDGLIGTLFGYGRDNAWAFEERNHGKKVHLVPVWDDEVYDYLKKRPRPNWLIHGLGSEDLSEMLGFPTFLAKPDSIETQELKKKFIDTREKIIDYYKNKDFLEASLSLLINGNPSARVVYPSD